MSDGWLSSTGRTWHNQQISMPQQHQDIAGFHWWHASLDDTLLHPFLISQLQHMQRTHAYRFLYCCKDSHKYTYIFQGPIKSPRKKKRPHTFGSGYENVPPSEVSQTHTHTHTLMYTHNSTSCQLVWYHCYIIKSCTQQCFCVLTGCCSNTTVHDRLWQHCATCI